MEWGYHLSDGKWIINARRIDTGKPMFTILTRNAAEDIAFIHERMPAILSNEVAADRLNPQYHGDDIFKAAKTKMKYEAC